MNSRRSVLKTLAVAMLCSAASPILAQTRRTDTIRALDTDSDGTIDLAEAKKAASAVFAKLDRDHDDTLSRRELLGRLSEREFNAADPDREINFIRILVSMKGFRIGFFSVAEWAGED